MNLNQDCPCNSNKTYGACCYDFHSGKSPASSAEALMRSRYSAYVLGISDYVVKTTHPKFRGKDFKENIKNWMNQTRWTDLEVLEVSEGLLDDEMGEVEFVAEFILDGQCQILHEKSTFVKYKGRWVYTEGIVSPR